MPIFTIEDSVSGRRLKIDGDSAPTPQEMEELFAANPIPKSELERYTSPAPSGDSNPRNAQLNASPPESLARRVTRPVREFLSPVLGPTREQIARDSIPWGPNGELAYKPLGSRVDTEGLTGALFTQDPESPLFVERTPIDPNASKTSQRLTAAKNVGANLVNAISSPGSMLTMGMAGAAPSVLGSVENAMLASRAGKVAGGLFAADVARHIPEAVTEVGKAYKDGSPGEFAEALGNLGLLGAGTVLGGAHALSKGITKAQILAEAISEQAAQMGPGEFRPIGDFATPARAAEADLAAQAALNPVTGQWQPLNPTQLRNAPQRIAEALYERPGLEPVSPEGFTAIDQLVAQERFMPQNRPTGPVIADSGIRAVRENPLAGELGFRRAAEDTASIVPEATREAFLAETARSQMEAAGQALPDQVGVVDPAMIQDANLLDLRTGTFQMVDPDVARRMASAIYESGVRERIAPEGYSVIDQLVAESMFYPRRQSSGEIVTSTAPAGRSSPDQGRLGFRRGAVETASIVPEATREAIRREDVQPNTFPEPVQQMFRSIEEARTTPELQQALEQQGGSVTSLAYKIGELTDTPEKLAQLDQSAKRINDTFRERMDAIKAETDLGKAAEMIDELAPLAMKGQFYREAREYATGTGSAGDAARVKDPAFVPPMERPIINDRFLDLIDRGIERLKSDPTKLREGVTGLPEWLTREAARGVLQVVRAAYVGAKDLGAAIEQGVKWLKEQGVKADEAAMRDYLDSQLRWERIGSEADAGPTRVRASVERALRSSEITPEVKQALAQDPASKYQQQVVNPKKGYTSVSDIVAAMTDGDLAATTPNSSIYPKAKMEQARRLMRGGNDAAAAEVLSDLYARGTTFGQFINQFKDLKDVDPSFVVRLLNRQLLDHGYDALTEKQATALEAKSKTAIEANDRLEQAKKKWVEDPTEENAKAADEALAGYDKPALELQRAMLDLQPKSLPAVLKAVIQGNLLTPMSEVANIAGNLSVMPARASSDSIATAMDVLTTMVTGKPRQIIFQPIEGTKAGLRGLKEGFSKIPGIIKKGLSSTKTGENFRDIQPVRAWVKLTAKEPMVPTRGGKVPFADKAALALEGTAGVSPAVMLRGLSAGDAPPRSKSHAQAVEQQLGLSNVPAKDRPFARNFPELFLDEAQLARIQDETARAVFQRESETVNTLNRWVRNTGKKWLGRNGADWADLAFTVAVAPYRLTPWNLIGEYISYTPAGLVNFAVKVAKGDRLGAERALAKTMVGGMATTAAMWLYNQGLLAPSLDDQDEQQKARLATGPVLPPDHINITGLQRAMSGGDPAFQPGDSTVSVERLGIFGSIAHNTANIGRQREKSPEGETSALRDWTIGPAVETSKFALNQSFLKGAATGLDAIKNGDYDAWLRNMENALVSVPLPNTLSAASRAASTNKVVVKDDNKLKEFNNLIQDRLRIFGTGKDLPVRRGLWGEPLPETPEGANPIAYHFLDITRGQQVTQDPVAVEVYRLWRKTGDTAFLPTPPAKSIEVNGEIYELTPAQQDALQASVGPVRKRMMDRIVVNPNYQSLSDTDKKGLIASVYRMGYDAGKLQFLAVHGPDLAAKGKRAGFKPDPVQQLQLR